MSPRIPLSSARLTLLARCVLASCILTIAIFAFSPPTAGLHAFSWDKADHFCAFFALTCAAIVAFPKRQLFWIALWVSVAGAAIELVQGLPFVHRDCNGWDWVADNIGIGAVVGVAIAAQIRSWLAAATRDEDPFS